jgi:hypothetical protein
MVDPRERNDYDMEYWQGLGRRMIMYELKLDKEKLIDFAAWIRAIETPVVESPEAKDVLIEAMRLIGDAVWKLEDFCEQDAGR